MIKKKNYNSQNAMYLVNVGFLGGSDSKASACNPGHPDSSPGLGRSPGEGNGNPLQYSCLEKFHGQRSLVGYSPPGRTESDTTDRLHFHFGKYQDFPVGQLVKNPPAMRGTWV